MRGNTRGPFIKLVIFAVVTIFLTAVLFSAVAWGLGPSLWAARTICLPDRMPAANGPRLSTAYWDRLS